MSKYRTHTCNQLTKKEVGSKVRISGWINKKRDHGNLLFIDLRDNYGITQCIIDQENKNFKEIIDLLVKGKTYTHSFTIIEGMNIYDIEKELENSFLINDCSLLVCIKTNYPFKEGVLYPDTYFYKKGMKASDLLNKSHKKLDDFLNTIWIKKADNDILKDKYQALILASIIEKEAGNHSKTRYSSCFFKKNKYWHEASS